MWYFIGGIFTGIIISFVFFILALFKYGDNDDYD